MAGSMLAALLDGPGQPLRLAETTLPQPGPGEILVRLEASGVCHTDVHVWQGDMLPASGRPPRILGHEGIGRVVALGPGVSDWRTGQRAGVAWLHSTCGHCRECSDGMELFCQGQKAHGFDVPGTFATHVVAEACFAAVVPDEGAAAALAPLMCAGLTAFGSLQRAQLARGETCAIFGCGGLGLYAVQIAKRLGARVVAIDIDEAKLRDALTLGADHVVIASRSAARDWPAELRADVCINFAPTTATWDAMVAAIRPRGRIIAAAMVSEPVPLRQDWLTSTGVLVTGTSVGTRAQMRALMAMNSSDPLVATVTRIGLEDATEALCSLRDGTARGRQSIVFDA